MTVNDLQTRITQEIEQITEDMFLLNKKGEFVKLEGYSQAIPIQSIANAYDTYDTNLDETDDLFPYFVVRLCDIDYQNDNENLAHVMIVFAIIDDNPNLKGYFTLSSIIERVVMRFQTNPMLGPFYCKRQMSVAYQEDDTYPQFFGGIEMYWVLPDVGNEENYE